MYARIDDSLLYLHLASDLKLQCALHFLGLEVRLDNRDNEHVTHTSLLTLSSWLYNLTFS